MIEFETALHDCLEALTEGRLDVDACLRQYPEHAAALRPLLLAATVAGRAYDVQPRPEFAAAARERFLIATGQRLREAMDLEPSPSFFAAARSRFLFAAQRLRAARAEQQRQRQPRHVPLFVSPFRALAGGMAAIALFLSFSAYTVASASAALPGDWQYPIKLQTERVRLALAFSEDDKRSVKLDMAEERVHEIEQLGEKGKIIGPGVLDRLVEQTQPLIDDAQDGGWDAGDAARLQQMAGHEKQVLAEVEPQVAPAAQEQLSAAQDVSKAGLDVSTRILFDDPDRQPTRVEASVELSPVPATATPDGQPSASATPEPSTPEPGGTEPPPSDTPTPESTPAGITIGSTPAASRNGVPLLELTAGRLKLLIPGPSTGWYLKDTGDGSDTADVPLLLNLSKVDGSSFVAVSTLTGDMYWYINRNGTFDEVEMRATRNGTVFIADADVLRAAYGGAADIPLYMAESIELAPLPATPTDTPAALPSTKTPVPTATP